PQHIRIKWAIRADQIERSNQRMNDVIIEQQSYFSDHGIKAVLLKGQGVASCYTNPLRRVSGDVDWYLEGKDYYTILGNLQKHQKLSYPLDSFGYNWRGVHSDFHHR